MAFTEYLPHSRGDLKEVFQRFIGSDRAFGRTRAEEVWNRNERSCDIQDLNDAISRLPAFGNDDHLRQRDEAKIAGLELDAQDRH